MVMKPNEVIQLAKNHECKFVDLKFIDLPGIWQHTTVPVSRLNEQLFEEGLGFDGSSVRGWQPINASDMQMIPDPSSARVDPFSGHRTLSLVCDIKDPITGEVHDWLRFINPSLGAFCLSGALYMAGMLWIGRGRRPERVPASERMTLTAPNI